MNELVSVIVPVYNVEKYLNKCLDSIVNQTYKNLEIILVNDGSTDNSGIICDEYALKDDRIKVIHKKNEGQAVARNCALDIITGEFIAFVDSDDFIKSNMIQTMIEVMVESESDVAICGVVFRHCKGIENNFCYVNRRVVGCNDLLMCKYFQQRVITAMWNKIYKAKVFENIRFPAVRCREDTYILHEVLGKCKKFVEIPDCLYVQNIRDGSTEQKPFSMEKLDVTYDALRRRREYAKINYPQFYHYTEMAFVDLYYEMLQEIVARNGVKPQEPLYMEIFNNLKQEISLVNASALTIDDKKRLECIIGIINCPNKLLYECHKQKICFFVKR